MPPLLVWTLVLSIFNGRMASEATPSNIVNIYDF